MITGIIEKIFGAPRAEKKPKDLLELDAARRRHQERAENVGRKADDLSDVLGNLVRNMKGPRPRCAGGKRRT